MKRLAQRLFRLLPKPIDGMVRSFSRKINGTISAHDLVVSQVLPPEIIEFSKSHISEFVQESYKWPTSLIRTPLGSGSSFRDAGVGIANFADCVVAGDGRAFDSRHRLITESLATHDYQAFNPGRWAHSPSLELDGPVLALNWWSGNTNLYHWLRDVFARAFVLTELHDEPINIVCTKDPRPFQRHGLDALLRRFPQCRLHELEPSEKVRVENLVQPCMNKYIRGNGFLRREVADFVRDIYLDGVAVKQETALVYISRAEVGSRRILDESELIDRVSQRFSIHVSQIEQLPFADQLSLMAGTKVLMGIYGAGLIHLLFTKRNGLVEIHNGDSRETHFSTLSSGLGVPYAVVQGGPANRNQDFRLGNRGIDELLSILERMKKH
jgi:hypothetical protein